MSISYNPHVIQSLNWAQRHVFYVHKSCPTPFSKKSTTEAVINRIKGTVRPAANGKT